MKINKVLIVVTIIILTAVSILNADGSGGSYGAVFKNRGTAGYFSTGKAIADNAVDYIFYNPAGIANAVKSEISMTGAKLFDEIDGLKQIQAGLIYKLKNKPDYSFGIDYTGFNIDGIRESTEAQDLLSGTGLTGKTYDASFKSITIAGAKKINKNFNAGVSLIYYDQNIYSRSYKNTVLNAGCQYGKSGLSLNLTINNLYSTEASPLREKEKMPLIIEFGIVYELFDNLKIGAVFDKEENRNVELRAGAHYKFFESLRFNAGYINESKQPSAGFNLIIKNVKLDYAFLKHKELDITHKLTVSIKL